MYQFFFVKKHLGGVDWAVPFAVYPPPFFFLVHVRPLIFRRHQEIHLAYSPRIVTVRLGVIMLVRLGTCFLSFTKGKQYMYLYTVY